MESFVAQMNQKPLLFPVMLNQQVGMPRFPGNVPEIFHPLGWRIGVDPFQMAFPIHGL